MTGPIPIFRFVFAAYYATSYQWDHEYAGVSEKTDRLKSEFPAVALVVNNDSDATPQKSPWLCERAWEYKIE
jgi:hypothetical protein